MKLNLRKASALQIAINEQIAATEMPVSVTIDRYSAPDEVTGKAVDKLAAGLEKKRDLFNVLYSIRMKTAAASEAAGVSTLLAKSAYADKVIGLLTPLAATRTTAKTLAQLEEAVADLRKETTQQAQYGYQKRDSFDVSIIGEDAAAAWKTEIADLKRQKQAFSDALLEANIKNEIEVSGHEEEILKKYGIL